MNDDQIPLEVLKRKIHLFVQERNWQQFHTPKNLSMALGKEPGKLFEQFLWVGSQASMSKCEQKKSEIDAILGRLAFFLLSFCALYDIDLTQSCNAILQDFERTYTLEKSKDITNKINNY